MMEKFEEVLQKFGNNHELHAKLLNTLSLLEYIGARKIIKSQVDRHITSELLGHIAEEIRHSQLLKALALKLSNQVFTTYQEEYLICGSAAKAYIQNIDHGVEKALPQKDEWANYLLTTLLIEERAAKAYPIYEAHLQKMGFVGKLRSIIRDEDQHLQSVTEQLQFTKKTEIRMDLFRIIEETAFQAFMDCILLSL